MGLRFELDRDWSFSKDDALPIRVCLPHDAMRTERRTADSRNGVQSGFFPGGLYTYSRSVGIDPGWIGKRIEVFFEGVYRNATIFVNGERVADHAYGFTEFKVDVSAFVTAGENRLSVRVDNSLVPNCRWYSGAGLYRPVWLLVDEPKEPRIVTKSYDPAVIEVTGADGIEIYDGEKRIAKGGAGEYEIRDARLWSDETPYLYTCVANGRRIRFGIRKIEWTARNGLRINGKRTLLRGGCIHSDNGVLGACTYPGAERRRVEILKAQGFNALRCAHNPASRALLDACDELGMLVMDECFDGWYIPKDHHDYSRQFMEHHDEDLAAMVDKDFNHPSVILYSIGNEVTELAEPRGIALASGMRDLVAKLDGTRPVTCGVNVLLNVYAKLGIGVYRDKGSYAPVPLPEGRGYRERRSGSAFFNAMAGKLGRLMFLMSRNRMAERLVASAAPSMDIVGLNYASSRYDIDVLKYPDRMMVGSETMAADLPYNWERVKKHPQLIGDFVWSAWDYMGEACIGDWTYHSYEGLPLLAGQGMIDITGKPLASMAFLQTVWGERNHPFIAVSPLNHADERPSTGAWQFTNAIDSWTWHGFEGKKTVVEVYSDAASVRLELNGKRMGDRKTKDFRTTFRIVYAPGTLTAVALDAVGQEISRSCLTTGGSAKTLAAKVESTAGGLHFLSIEFTDGDGTLLPYVEQSVRVGTESCTLLGLGSARCKTDERHDGEVFTSFRGRLLAVVQGHGRVTIESLGVRPVVVEVGA